MNLEITPEKLASIIKDGVAGVLEQRIKEELQKVVEPIVSQVARDLAQKTVVNVKAFHDYADPFGGAKIILQFNNEEVKYQE